MRDAADGADQNGGPGVGAPDDGDFAPLRTVQDPHSTFTGIAVDPATNEVIINDDNRFNLLIYDRSVKTDGVAEPKRRIGGHKTKIEFISGVSIDAGRREIYTVNNDVIDNMLVFSYDQQGDVAAARELKVDHGAWGVSVDPTHEEVAVSIQHTNKIVVYRRTAQGGDVPVRLIQGKKTGISDPHGVYVDSKNDEIVLVNQSSAHDVEHGDRRRAFDPELEGKEKIRSGPSTGRFVPPSITVYARTANGDVAPLRTIQGSNTRLSLPLGIYVDTEHGEIYVANDGGHSVLVFGRTADGRRRALENDRRTGDGLEESRRGGRRYQERRGVGHELGRPQRDVYPRDGERKRGAVANHPERPPRDTHAGDRESRRRRLRLEARSDSGAELSEPSAYCGVRQVGERKCGAGSDHRGSGDETFTIDARNLVRRSAR